jgi:hypothetical protein
LSQDPRKRPTIDELLANPIITRRRAALSSVMDSTLKAAIALEEDVDFLGTIAVRCAVVAASKVCFVMFSVGSGAEEHQTVDASAAGAMLP